MFIADVMAKDEAGAYSDDEFDTALWQAVCDRLDSKEDLEALPDAAWVCYLSRRVEWQVGNGGFAQAVLNVPHLLEPAAEAFDMLSKPQVAVRIREAHALYEKEKASLPEVRPDNLTAISEHLDEDAFDHLDEGLDEIGFWSDKERLAFVRAHRDEFRNLT